MFFLPFCDSERFLEHKLRISNVLYIEDYADFRRRNFGNRKKDIEQYVIKKKHENVIRFSIN